MTSIDASSDPLINQNKGMNAYMEDRPQVSHIERSKQEKDTAAKSMLWKQIRMFALIIFVDVGAPVVIYYILKNYTSVIVALIVSGIPPLLHVIISFIYRRKVEVIGCISIFSFILSAVLSLISGDARMALLRDSFTTLVVSVAFLITLIPLRTKWFSIYPLTFLIMKSMLSESPPMEWYDEDGNKNTLPTHEFLWNNMPNFPKYQYINTSIWGFTLLSEFIIKVIMIEATTLTIDEIVTYSTIVVAVSISLASVASVISSIYVRRKCISFVNEWKKVNDYSYIHQV
ncbi:unnamed protein product [Cunninghamella blakesleeana]